MDQNKAITEVASKLKSSNSSLAEKVNEAQKYGGYVDSSTGAYVLTSQTFMLSFVFILTKVIFCSSKLWVS